MAERQPSGFTLIELLAVLAIVGILAALLAPGLMNAIERGRVATVHHDLRQVEVALTLYYAEQRHFPPVRVSCNTTEQSHWCQLPPELVEGGWLPPGGKPGMVAALEDPFNPGHAYKYAAPGPYYMNNELQQHGFAVFVPADFPSNRADAGVYHDTDDSPLAWVVWSLGPRQDRSKALHARAPLSEHTWYQRTGDHGVIARYQHRLGGSRQTP